MKKLMIAMAAMGLSSVAMAGPSWTFVDLGYAESSSSEELVGTEDISGYDITGSFGFAGIWHINGTYGTITTESIGSSDVDVDRYRIGIGAHPAITDSTDFVAEVGYTAWEVDVAGDPEPDAIDLTLGVRSMVTDRFELNAFLATQIGSSDFGGSDDDFTNLAPSVGGQYFFTDNVSVNLSYSWNDVQSLVVQSLTADTARFGVRWSF
jgi:opacity protein-like surface antigen